MTEVEGCDAARSRTQCLDPRSHDRPPVHSGPFFTSPIGQPGCSLDARELSEHSGCDGRRSEAPLARKTETSVKHLRRATVRAGTTADGRANELSVETRQAGAGTIVVVIGRVTVDSSPHLRSVLHDAIGAPGASGVVIDLTGTSYLDTSAIATLLEAATLALAHAVALQVTGLQGHARFVAEGAELDHIFLALGYEVQFT